MDVRTEGRTDGQTFEIRRSRPKNAQNQVRISLLINWHNKLELSPKKAIVKYDTRTSTKIVEAKAADTLKGSNQ